ncbi:ER membrane protein complex subunit 8 [Echinococcus granulosus]|uniref:Neighbor of COX4 n=2 Tax=Echinococcus granulosus TaxID=6210 RepID=W6V3X0_ECHGR|nr:Neighbor of COX4 [Echinococcus granulosus]EUB60759.1 Neighbor of COX4 [Echinococcus granulosus]KAH9282125.1 ER membrane protein complex subunit 8 [Echinococcus granulosus]
MAPVHLESLAFAKIILHVSKYPHAAVNGVLLGDIVGGKLVIRDCIPLFHGCLTLTPMIEVALTQIEVYCDAMNWKICGYYQANETLNSNELNLVATRIGDKIFENSSQGNIIIVRNDRLRSLSPEAFSLYCRRDGSWQETSRPSVEQSAAEFVKSFLDESIIEGFADFDNHLDNILMDWRNIGFFHLNEIDKVK